jgi:N-acyl homoserine lactone hydrolase
MWQQVHRKLHPPTSEETTMSTQAITRLYLMQVGDMPQYDIPIVCYLAQTGDGKNILIDSGLPAALPEDASDFANGQDVIAQLAQIGLTPGDIDIVVSTHYDVDHAGRHAAFQKAQYVVQRAHQTDAASNPRYASIRAEWDQPIDRIRLIDGDTELLPGLTLIETTGHVPGHQSVLVRLPNTGVVLLTVDAVPFKAGFVRDLQDDGRNLDFEGIRASTIKLIDLAEREHAALVIFGHEADQWRALNKAPGFYE